MDNSEIIIKKHELEREISDKIANFEKTTKFKIERLDITRKEVENNIIVKGIEIIFKL